MDHKKQESFFMHISTIALSNPYIQLMQGKAYHGMERKSNERYFVAWHGKARQGMALQGMV
jgi:hypothetical protein